MKQDKVYFGNLDGARFYAFLVVLTAHLFNTNNPEVTGNAVYRFIIYVTENNYIVLKFFFLLSSFLITYLLIYEKSKYQKINLPYYFYRRILRIWPLYFLVVCYGFFLYPWFRELAGQEHVEESANIWYYLAFLPNMNNIWNGFPEAANLIVLWSIGVEEQFYIFWALIIAFTPTKYLIRIFTLVIIIGILLRVYVYNKYGFGYELHQHSFSSLVEFSMGSIIAYFAFNRKEIIDRLCVQNKLANGLIYLLGISFVILKTEIFNLYFLAIFESLLVSFFFSFVIIDQCYNKRAFIQFGAFKFATYWGIRSYGLYVYHVIFIGIVTTLFKKLNIHNELNSILIFEPLLIVVLTMLASYLSFKYFESYFLKLKNKYSHVIKGK